MRSLVFILILAHNGLIACNCLPILDQENFERRSDISDLVFLGEVIKVEKSNIPYDAISVSFVVRKQYKGDKSDEVIIKFDAMTSCGIHESLFKIGQKNVISARKNIHSGVEYFSANQCDLSNPISSVDKEFKTFLDVED
ncbi:MAG: hypothetical protein MRY83_09585 [Flavobacteriales bacterium]|nr:hypothetical protein [Flavobacteriales bacterium]